MDLIFWSNLKHCSPLKLLRRLKVLILLILHLIFQWCIEINYVGIGHYTLNRIMKTHLEFEVECNSNLCPHLFSSLFLVCHNLTSQCHHATIPSITFQKFFIFQKLQFTPVFINVITNFSSISHLKPIRSSLSDSSAQTEPQQTRQCDTSD